MSTIPAGVFKAKCLEIMDEVERTKEEVIVTKYGRPVAKLVPIDGAKTKPFVGSMAGTVVSFSDDVFESEEDLWKVFSDEE